MKETKRSSPREQVSPEGEDVYSNDSHDPVNDLTAVGEVEREKMQPEIALGLLRQ